jgi:amphi-Trp domain-containing protein
MSKEEFEHESVQDNETVSQYLQAMIEGFRNGKITFKSEDDELVLFPNNLLEFVILAKKKGDKNKISLRFTWKDSKEERQTRSFKITS